MEKVNDDNEQVFDRNVHVNGIMVELAQEHRPSFRPIRRPSADDVFRHYPQG